MRGRDLKVHVQLGYGFDAARFKERFARGQAIEYTPYDFHLAERPGVAVSFSSDDRPPPGRLAGIVGRRLRFAIDHAWYNRHAIAASDVVWTMSENEAFGAAALMAARVVPRRPIIGTAIWLFNGWDALPAHARALFRALSRHISVMTVHSNGSLAAGARAGLHCPVELSAFGVNADTYAPLPPRPAPDGPIRVLAAGNDRTRDWGTLLAALGGDDRFAVSAWTSVLGAAEQARYGNLHLPKPPDIAGILAMYAEADAVIVPMVPNVFSGITVALEAASLGRPVISSDTGGVPTYFGPDEVRFVPPGDAGALREAALAARSPDAAAMAARARARFVAGDYTTRGMVDRYLALSERVMGRS
jgi:glycosyltransferase involved in cell wall biosynthesis